MREMVEVRISKKNGKITIEDTGMSNSESCFRYTVNIGSGEEFSGFDCGKEEINEYFVKYKEREIKSRNDRITQLRKEIERINKLQLKTK